MSKIKKVSKEELELLPHKDCVRFALFCAEQVRDSWKDIPECVVAIETAERWLEGKASAEECKVAAYASAGKPHLIEAQWEYYNELLHFDDIAEKALLGEIV